MITENDFFVAPGEWIDVEYCLSAFSKENKGGRPADVALKFNGEIIVEPSFAELKFDSDRGLVVPFITVIKWSSLLIIVGARKVLIFPERGEARFSQLMLFRRESDDTGFYVIEFKECDNVLVCIYEGGVWGVLPSGRVFKHLEKKWDDVLESSDGCRLTFLLGDGGRRVIDFSAES